HKIKALPRVLYYSTKCYRMDCGVQCEFSPLGGFNALPGKKGLRMGPCVRLLLGPKRARSTPTLAVGSSNSGLPGQGREDQKATGPSSFSDKLPEHSSCTGSPKVSGRTLMPMRKNSSRKPRSTSWG